jgi:hypothetical protein
MSIQASSKLLFLVLTRLPISLTIPYFGQFLVSDIQFFAD